MASDDRRAFGLLGRACRHARRARVGLLEPADLEDADLAALYAAYREELDGLASGTVTHERGARGQAVADELAAWRRAPGLRVRVF